jgi:hypothetical protein
MQAHTFNPPPGLSLLNMTRRGTALSSPAHLSLERLAHGRQNPSAARRYGGRARRGNQWPRLEASQWRLKIQG